MALFFADLVREACWDEGAGALALAGALPGHRTFAEYLKHVEKDSCGDELTELLDAIATNHTYFFREEQHFDMLRERVVPEWRAKGGQGPFKVWSAACSTGEEPYTIAMTLRAMTPAPDFTIAASDLSTKALRAAKAGIYKMAGVQSLPRDVLKAHFERGMGEQAFEVWLRGVGVHSSRLATCGAQSGAQSGKRRTLLDAQFADENRA